MTRVKHLFILFSTVIFFASKAYANAGDDAARGQLSGKVIDSVTKTPVSYATISIFKQGSTTPFNGVVTTDDGGFVLNNLAMGNYRIVVDFIGYRKKTINNVTLSKSASNVSLGNILLSPSANQLKEVAITAQAATVENKIDKMVYNPGTDLTTQGGVALDVMQKVPMVSVDINGNVELMGNSNVQFLINGKPSTVFGSSITDALQAIPASQIKSIEVITNPGAKYDASGTGGIINIILKDNNVQGVNGNLNLNAGTRLENANFNLNAKKGKLGFNAFFGGNANLSSATPSSSNSTSNSNSSVTTLNEMGSSNFKRSGYRSGLSLNWDITPKDQLTGSVNFNHFGNQGSGYTNVAQNTLSTLTNSSVDTLSINNSSSKFSFNSTDVSLAYKKTFENKDQELDILYNYSDGRNTNNYSQQLDYTNVTHPSTGSIGNNPGTDKETDIMIDYAQPVAKGFTIETGAKATIENLNNSVFTQTLDSNGVYKPYAAQTYGFTYGRKIFAFYLSTSFSLFNDFINGKAGLREEYTVSTSNFPNTNIPSYGILAPSFVLQHKLNQTESIKFSYSYRLERPDYRSLNPFYNISDPHNISTGDPNLKPELGHNFELGYNKSFDKGPSIYVAAFYRYNTNDLQSFTHFYPSKTIGDSTYTNVYLSQRYNIGREATEGINLYGSMPVGKLTFRSNMFFADRITDNPGSPQVTGFMYRINLNTSYEFAKDLAAEFFVNYRSSQKGIQGTNPAFLFYDFAVRKQFDHKKFSVGLTAANPFNQYVNVNSTTFGSNFYQTSLRQIPLRSFGISLMYKFGKMEFKKDKDKDDNNNNNNAPDNPDSGGK
ncbi:MAG TPA: outer membrane beta-barrel family protein [Mucilaginibacter sp.]|nr:outer membrane beta-barrel family protein [Mucilaginibacter sp.]